MDRRFGAELKRLRKERSITQRQVAETMGWTVSYIHEIEVAKTYPPSRDRIAAIADYLGASDHLAELLRLAVACRGVISFAMPEPSSPDVTDAIVAIAKACESGKLEASTARQISRLLEPITAVA